MSSATRNNRPGEMLPDHSPLYSGQARTLSLLLALAISVGVLAWPHLVMRDDGGVDHRWVSLLLWGMAAGFVHGVGFVPRNRLLRQLLGPVAAWALPLVAIVAIRLL
jgi:cyd operon protein YbgE